MAKTQAHPRQVRAGEVTLTDAATVAVDASLGTRFKLSTASSRTIGAPSNPVAGQQIVIAIENTHGSTDQTMTMTGGAGGFAFGAEITAISATAFGKTDYITAIYDSSNNRWHIVGYSKGYST